MIPEADVLVVGGGIAGLATALAAAEQGLSVVVLEQLGQPAGRDRTEVLQPRSLEILDRWGILPAIQAVTVPVHETRLGEQGDGWLAGARLTLLGGRHAEGRSGLAGDVHRALLDAAGRHPRIRLLWRTEARRLLRDADGAVCGAVTADAGPVRARVTVGADGRTSLVREQLGVESPYYRHPLALASVTVEAEEEPAGRIDMLFGQGDAASVFPLPGRRVRLALMVSESTLAWMREQPDRGLSYLQYRLSAYFPEHAVAVSQIRSMRDVQILPAGSHLASRWVADGAALVGEAAHGVSPVRGQGANLALADAWELGGLLGALLRAGGRPDARALAPYEERRRAHVRYIQADGDLTAAFVLTRSPLGLAVRRRILRNVMRAPRATMRVVATFAGLHLPAPLERACTALALTVPPLDRLLPA